VAQGDFGGRRPLLAFAALALGHGAPVERDLLAEVLWPDERMPRSWNAAVRSVLSRLRAVLHAAGFGQDALRSVGSAVVLFLAADLVVDVNLAASLIEAGRASLADGLLDPARLAAGEAAGLLATPFLAGVPSTWADERRASLADLRAEALEVLASADLAAGNAHRAAASAGEAVRLAPLRESASRLLMASQHAIGNPAEGLRTYDRLRARLGEDLGLHPSGETERLRIRLVADLGGAPAPPAGAAPAPATGRVAASTETSGSAAAAAGLRTRRRYPLVGRDDLLAELEQWWSRIAEGDAGAVVLSGEQGSGKTRIAAELAEGADPAAVVYGRCSPHADGSGSPFGDAVWRWSRRAAAPPDHGDDRHDGAPTWPAVAEDIAAWLERLARSGPVLVVVDDVQWAAAPTLDAIVTCGRLLTHHVGLVVTRREPPLQRSGPLPAMLTALATVQPVLHRTLAPLTAADVRRLVALDGGADEGPDGPVATALTEATGGNAFLVTEQLTHLAQLGDLAAWPPPDRLTASVPRTVSEAVLARLDQLEAEDLAVLAHAVALGSPIDAVRVADDAGFVPTFRAVAAGVRLGLLVAEGGGRFRLQHGLVREALASPTGGLAPSGSTRLWSRAAVEAWQLDPARADELADRWWPGPP